MKIDTSWTKINHPMSVNRSFCSAVAAKNQLIYVFGGGINGGGTNVVEIYDIANEKIYKLSEKMPKKLFTCEAVSDGKNNLYVVGGYRDIDGHQDGLYHYNIKEKKWTTLEKLNVKRNYLSALCINGKIYAIGGFNNDNEDGSGEPGALDTVEVYDTNNKATPEEGGEEEENRKWTILPAKLNGKRLHCCSAEVNGIIYIFGGFDGDDTFLNTIETYDTTSSNPEWKLIPNAKMKFKGRVGASAVVLPGEGEGGEEDGDGPYIIIIGGSNQNLINFNSIEIFNTKTNTFVNLEREGELPIDHIYNKYKKIKTVSTIQEFPPKLNKHRGNNGAVILTDSDTPKRNPNDKYDELLYINHKIVVIGGGYGHDTISKRAEMINIKIPTIESIQKQKEKTKTIDDNSREARTFIVKG